MEMLPDTEEQLDCEKKVTTEEEGKERKGCKVEYEDETIQGDLVIPYIVDSEYVRDYFFSTPLGEKIMGNAAIPDSFIRRISFPHNGKMTDYTKRLETFEHWPKQMQQQPEQLAKAGFYYTGKGDKCKCFCCGLALFHWDYLEDPKEEHKRYKRKCECCNILDRV